MAKANSSKTGRKAVRKAAGNKPGKTGAKFDEELLEIASQLGILFDGMRAYGERCCDTFWESGFGDLALMPGLMADRGEALIDRIHAARASKKGGAA